MKTQGGTWEEVREFGGCQCQGLAGLLERTLLCSANHAGDIHWVLSSKEIKNLSEEHCCKVFNVCVLSG